MVVNKMSGVYVIPAEELIPMFESFLRDLEGDVTAQSMAETWNFLSDKYGWGDYLEAGD
jgi:hypothetical protein